MYIYSASKNTYRIHSRYTRTEYGINAGHTSNKNIYFVDVGPKSQIKKNCASRTFCTHSNMFIYLNKWATVANSIMHKV